MPAGLRVQQLTPVVRPAANQAATIVRLMSPVTSTIRPGTGQQQIIQLNTTKQQQNQPLVIKAITATGTNRQQQQQQPILLTTTSQQKAITPQTGTQQILVLNQNSFNNHFQGSQPKLTLQMTNVDPTTINHNDHQPQESTTNETNLPQLDGIYIEDSFSDQMDVEKSVETVFNQMNDEENSFDTAWSIPQLDGTVDDQVMMFGL